MVVLSPTRGRTNPTCSGHINGQGSVCRETFFEGQTSYRIVQTFLQNYNFSTKKFEQSCKDLGVSESFFRGRTHATVTKISPSRNFLKPKLHARLFEPFCRNYDFSTKKFEQSCKDLGVAPKELQAQVAFLRAQTAIVPVLQAEVNHSRYALLLDRACKIDLFTRFSTLYIHSSLKDW